MSWSRCRGSAAQSVCGTAWTGVRWSRTRADEWSSSTNRNSHSTRTPVSRPSAFPCVSPDS